MPIICSKGTVLLSSIAIKCVHCTCVHQSCRQVFMPGAVDPAIQSFLQDKLTRQSFRGLLTHILIVCSHHSMVQGSHTVAALYASLLATI